MNLNAGIISLRSSRSFLLHTLHAWSAYQNTGCLFSSCCPYKYLFLLSNVDECNPYTLDDEYTGRCGPPPVYASPITYSAHSSAHDRQETLGGKYVGFPHQ